MSEEGQSALGDFGENEGSADRPADEAAAVAGEGGDGAAVVDIDERQFPDTEETVEFVVMQVDYTIEGQGDDEYPVVHVFGRTEDNVRVHARVHDFKPYFYAPVDSVSEDRLRQYDSITGWEDVDADDEPYESIRGERLRKIFGQTPRDVGQIRDDFDHYEADILFPNRLLVDKDITSGVQVPARELEDGSFKVHHEEIQPVEASADPRVNTFDIEVDDRHGFPEDGVEPIVCLTSHDSYADEYIVWLYESPDGVNGPEALAGYEPIREDFEADVRVFEEEEAMLEAFVDYIEATDPDILTGWNCLPADSDVLMGDGTVKAIENVEIGDSVVGSEDTETTVTTVTNKWESTKEILRFELADGTAIRASPEHRIMTGDDDSVDWKDAGEIEAGEYVLKPRRLNVDDPTVPTLRSLIPIEKQRYANDDTVRQFKSNLPHGAVSELADEFEPEKETLYHPKTSTWTPKRCRRAANTFDLPVPDGGRVYNRTDVGIDRELTPSELYLAGLVLTDGTLSTEGGIRFYNTREELHDQFPGEAALTPDGTGCYKQNVLDYARLHAFHGLGIPFGEKNSADVDLSTIYEMPEPFVAQFLAGVIDGDGSIDDSVTVAAENESIGDWYVKLFKRLGVYATRRDNVVRVPNAARDIERVKRQVLPHMSHSEKVDRLRTLEGGTSGRSENIPVALFEAAEGTDARRIGRDKHRRGISLKRHETTVDEWEEYVFVEVTDRATDGTETTYDIETTTHNFIADDCLVHNCDDFDIPYYLDRLEELRSYDHDYDLDIDRLSRVNEVWRSGWGGPDIKGRVVFDLLYAYKRTQFTELESYRLDAVGEQELGVGKERYAGDIGDLWEQDPERLLEYNLRDVELCVELDREQDIIDFWDEVRTFVGCKLEDATTPGDAVDMYVLHKLHGEYALPSKGQQESEDYEGGAVFDPITGVRENVSVLDLKCFSGDTELMTPEGAKNIKNVQRGDDIYTLNPDTFECEIKQVTETHQYENKYGELHHLSGNTHDFKITENHRLLASKERGWDDQEPEDFEFTEYRDIPEYERFAFPQHGPMAGRSPETFSLIDDVEGGNVVVYTDEDLRVFRSTVPSSVRDSLELIHGSSAAMGIQKSVGKYLIPLPVYREHKAAIDEHADDVFLKYGERHRETPLGFEMDDWLELLGWFVTEGSTDRANGRLTLHQSDETGRAAIQELLERMDINYNVDKRGVNISNQYLLDWLGDNCGEGCENKQLPEWVFELDAELLAVLLNTMIRGDGSRAESGLGKFWTKSPQLRDGAADIAIRCGHKPTVSQQSDGTYYVSIGKRGSFKKSTNADVEDHDDDVYCVTAQDNHVVLAGRNGNFQWIGQSLYPMCMVTTNASPETKVDPENYDGDTYRAPNGTHFRREPDGVIRSMVDELLSEREEKKELRNSFDPENPDYERYDRQQAAVKVIMNSLYGVLGWDRFRLYDKEMGAAVTATGREVIDYTDDVVENAGYEVVYGDSVTGERPIVVRDPDRNVRIQPIESLFERAKAGSKERGPIASDGGTAAGRGAEKDRLPLSGWDALSIDDDGKTEWRPITQVIRHETEKDVVTLRHKFGESTTTRDHSYVVEENGDLVERAPDDVDEPLRVDGLPDVDTVETIDVYEVLDGYTRTYEDGRMVGSENAVEKTKRVHADSDWVWFGHEHHDAIEKYPKVKRHIDLTGEDGRALVRLLAAYVAEGSASTAETSDSRYGASISESRREWLEGLQTDYQRLFKDTTASIIHSDSSDQRTVEYETADDASSASYDDGTKKLQLMDELAAVFFRKFAGQQSRGKRIPSFVFRLPDDLQSLFLDVLVEGDGSREFPRYAESYAERNFDYETTSRELAGGLSMLLTQRGEKHSLKYRDAKDSYTIRTCDFYRSGRDPVVTETDHDGYVYDLSVEANENFVDAVGGIVLHNTDSVMLQLGDIGPDDVDGEIELTDEMRAKHPEMSADELETVAATIQKGFELEDSINASYDEFALEELNAEFHRFEIEFEKLYRRFFQAGKKKRYAGHIVWKEGKHVDSIDITGFEYKRSDIAPITKRVQKEVIDRIVHGEDADNIKEYVGEVIEEYQSGNVNYDDVGIPGGIGKKLDNYDTDTAQVRGAKYANLLLETNFRSGSKPKRLYLDRVHADFFERIEDELGLDPAQDPLYGEFRRDPDVICFEYADQIPEEFEIDWEKMLEKTLKGPIARILEALDISWEEVKSGQEQTGLGQYM